MNFFDKIFGHKKSENKSEPKITVEKIQHIFEYGKLKNLIGTGDDDLKKFKVGNSISWKNKEEYYKGYMNIPAQTVPPHIKWSNDPVFAYVSIVEGMVQYHYSENGGSAVYICPVTNNTEHIKLIDEIFEHYYRKFNLPGFFNEPGVVGTGKADKTDKMKFLCEYLATQDTDFFYNNFCEDEDIYDIAMWIDCHEEDDNIISYCEKILQTNQLSVETINTDNRIGFETAITYNGQSTIIPYNGEGADRDTTIKTLNQIIQPDYEIRLFKNTLNSDTRCFLPLTKEQWLELEMKYAKTVDEKFEKITNNTRMFN